MKTVAALVALVGIVAVMPLALGGPANECQMTPPGIICRELVVSHQNLPVVNTVPYFDTYYLWIGAVSCESPTTNDCRGTPSAGAGVTTPAGPVGVGLFGILYQETNGAPGLQRFSGSTPADRMVLV